MKRWTARLGLSALAVLSTLVVVEAALRIRDRFRDEAAESVPSRHYDRSRAVYVPEASRRHPWSRDPDESPLRIAVIGDSFTLGAGIQLYDTYPLRLEQMLNLNDGVRPAEVHVYGGGGLCTFQQLRYLSEALARSPAVVVLGICLNDTEDWNRPEEFKRWRNESLPRKPSGWTAWWVRTSRLAAWIYRQREHHRSRRAHIEYFRRLYDPSYSGWVRFERALGDFKVSCDRAGAPFVAMVFPLLSWEFDEQDYPFGWIHDRIGEAAARHDIPVLDLLSAFRTTSSIRVELVPRLDGHPNEIGHRIAAETLFEYLVSEGFVDAAYAPRHEKSQVGYWQWMKKQMDPEPAPGETP